MANEDLQFEFDAATRRELIAKLQQQGLWDANKTVVKDVLLEFGDVQPVGIFAPIYRYIYDVIKDQPTVDDGTKYWFRKAGDINSDNREEPADNYIRGVTQYGLELRSKLGGLPQTEIDARLQQTSNLIGQSVVQEIVTRGGMPIFPIMISGDISQAIGNADLGNFQQDVGGWGGSFYYWDAPLHFRDPLQRSVGTAILSGGIPESEKPSLDEFNYANSNALADFGISTLLSATKGRVLPSVLGGPLLLLLMDLPVAGLAKAVKDVLESLQSGIQAQAPDTVKGILAGKALGIMAVRFVTGEFLPGPHAPSQVFLPPYVLSVAQSGDVTTTYSDGSAFTEDFGTDATNLRWSNAAGVAGDVRVTNFGAVYLDAQDGTGNAEAALLTADNRLLYVSGAGARVASLRTGSETLRGGLGANTFVLEKVVDGIQDRIVDGDGTGDIWIGATQLGGDAQAVAYNETAAAGTWGGTGQTQFKYDDRNRTLTITGGDVGTGQVVIANFDSNAFQEAESAPGYLGIHLALRDKLAIAPGAAENPFDDPTFDPDAIATPSSTISEGGAKSYTVFLPYEAGVGGQHVQLKLDGASASDLKVIAGDQTVAVTNGGFDITIAQGQRALTFALVEAGDIDTDASLTLSAKLTDSEGNGTYLTHSALNLTLDAQEEGSFETAVTTNTIFGDQAPDNPDDILTGTTVNDLILGRNGVDVINGLAGDDDIDGGTGDDDIGGQQGNDHIVGDDGDDLLRGDAGNDHIEGGAGEDGIAGGDDDDLLEGGGGANDVITGEAGNDRIFGGTKADFDSAFEDSSAVQPGSEQNWLDGADGDDVLVGDSGNDTLAGGRWRRCRSGRRGR